MEIDRRTLMGWMGFTGGSAMGAPWLRNKIFGAGTDPMIDLPEPQTTPTRWETSAAKKREVFQSIVSAISGGLSVTTGALLTTVLELLIRRESRETNFDRRNRTAPFSVTLRKQYDGPVKTVLSVSPERDDVASLAFEEAGNTVKFTAPAMKVFSLIVVAQ